MTTSAPSAPPWENSTDPAESGDWKRETQTSSNARDSRGPSVKVFGAFEQAPMKQRYSAVTSREAVYEVLKARTSE